MPLCKWSTSSSRGLPSVSNYECGAILQLPKKEATRESHDIAAATVKNQSGSRNPCRIEDSPVKFQEKKDVF